MSILDLSATSTLGIEGQATPPALGLRLAGRTRIRIDTFADAANITGDALAEIDVSTGVKPGDSAEVMTSRWQVKARYIFNK